MRFTLVIQKLDKFLEITKQSKKMEIKNLTIV